MIRALELLKTLWWRVIGIGWKSDDWEGERLLIPKPCELLRMREWKGDLILKTTCGLWRYRDMYKRARLVRVRKTKEV